MVPKDALLKATKVAGGQSALARAIDCKQQDIWRWLNKLEKTPAENVLAIEAATGVTRHELRPDLYPESEAAA